MLVSSICKYTVFHDIMTKIMLLPMCKTKTYKHQHRQCCFLGVRGLSISTTVWINYVNFLYFYNHTCTNHIVKGLNIKYKTFTYLSIKNWYQLQSTLQVMNSTDITHVNIHGIKLGLYSLKMELSCRNM
jgi:hypothetical protein